MTPDRRAEAKAFIEQYRFGEETPDPAGELDRAAGIMTALLDDQFDLQNHVAYLEGVVIEVMQVIQCPPGMIRDKLKWPRP